jgi:hypothetical protein
MRKILALFIIIFSLFPSKILAEEDVDYFVVTAYYSPLPNQEYYFTGDYESEIRLE